LSARNASNENHDCPRAKGVSNAGQCRVICGKRTNPTSHIKENLMRKWHRWLSFIFGAFLLFISVTGVASHVVVIWANGGLNEKEERRPPPPNAVTAPGTVAGAVAEARSAPNPTRKLVGWLHHLHSGEEFGPVGVVISLMSGFAMIFFSVSGLWMYFQMLTRRGKASKRGFFWE
jgi:hypothetical protein